MADPSLETYQRVGCPSGHGSYQHWSYAEDQHNAEPILGMLLTQHVVVACIDGACRTHVEDLPP
jgi:hypothetical protein